MELHQLEYFVAVWNCKGFTKAAKKLHVTQPTVTIAVRNLEKELNAPLFDRECSSLTLTPTGEEVLQRSQVILQNVEQLIQRVKDCSSFRQQDLAIAVPPISCAHLYPLLLREFAPAHPEVRLAIQDICNHEAIQKIMQGDLELGCILLPKVMMPGLDFFPIERGNLLVLLAEEHPLAKKDALTLEDIAQERIIMYEKDTSYIESRLAEEFSARRIPFRVDFYFNNFSTIYDMTAQNLGISFTMPTCSLSLQHLPGLTTRPFAIPLEYEIGLAWRKDMFLSSGAQQLIHFLRARYGQVENL